MMRALLTSLTIVTLLGAGAAHAGSAEDGNAGLEALKRGAYSEAVRLFTRALKAGDLARDDQEFAYLNRARAYAGEGKRDLALADLHKAAQLNPGDAEVRQELAALSGDSPRAVQTEPAVIDPDAAWGPLASLVGSTWMLVGPKPQMYLHYEREDPQTIRFAGMDYTGNAITGTLRLNPTGGTVQEVSAYKGGTATGAIVIDGNRYAEDSQAANGAAIRAIYTLSGPSAFQVEITAYQPDGTWKTLATPKYVQVSQDVVDALNWKAATPPKEPGFWTKLGRSLGNSIVQGAAAGLAAGVQGQPQQ